MSSETAVTFTGSHFNQEVFAVCLLVGLLFHVRLCSVLY